MIVPASTYHLGGGLMNKLADSVVLMLAALAALRSTPGVHHTLHHPTVTLVNDMFWHEPSIF